jgi:hypothetical protein
VVTYFVIQKGVNGWMKAKTYGAGGCPAGGTAPAKSYKYSDDGSVQGVTGCAIPDGTNAWISAATAAVVTLICAACLKWVVQLVERDMRALEAADEARAAALAAKAAAAAEGGIRRKESSGGANGFPAAAAAAGAEPATAAGPRSLRRVMARSFNAFTRPVVHGANVDIHEIIENDQKARRARPIIAPDLQHQPTLV